MATEPREDGRGYNIVLWRAPEADYYIGEVFSWVIVDETSSAGMIEHYTGTSTNQRNLFVLVMGGQQDWHREAAWDWSYFIGKASRTRRMGGCYL